MRNIIAIVTARSGSKGIVDKNLQLVRGKTLIDHALISAGSSKLITQSYISTDSSRYETIGKKAGALSLGLRSPELSLDTTKTTAVILDFCERLKLRDDDVIVLLQPTSPIRSGDIIDLAIQMTLKTGESSVTVAEIDEPHPYKMKIIKDGFLKPFLENSNSELPRQTLPKIYQLTGAVYVAYVHSIKSTGSLFSEHTNPVFQPMFANIDSPIDLDFLKYLIDAQKVVL